MQPDSGRKQTKPECAGVAQGIVSYGLPNAKPPAVFTRISPYRPWIDEVLKEN